MWPTALPSTERSAVREPAPTSTTAAARSPAAGSSAAGSLAEAGPDWGVVAAGTTAAASGAAGRAASVRSWAAAEAPAVAVAAAAEEAVDTVAEAHFVGRARMATAAVVRSDWAAAGIQADSWAPRCSTDRSVWRRMARVRRLFVRTTRWAPLSWRCQRHHRETRSLAADSYPAGHRRSSRADSHLGSHHHCLLKGHRFAPYFGQPGCRKMLDRNHRLDHCHSWAAVRWADSLPVHSGSRHPFVIGRVPEVRSLRQPVKQVLADRTHLALVDCTALENLVQRVGRRCRRMAHMDPLGHWRVIVAPARCSLVEEERVRVLDLGIDCCQTTGADLVVDNRLDRAGSAGGLCLSVVLSISIIIKQWKEKRDYNFDQYLGHVEGNVFQVCIGAFKYM